MSQQRQLAAILFTDIVGYTALMQENEHKAVQVINHYNEVLNKLVTLHQGKVLNNFGDGSLCTFNSVSDAIGCAIEIQHALRQEPVVPLRIGLHVGEVIVDDNKAMGDGVNLASRVQSLGHANAILFSREVYDKIRNRPEYKAVSLGQFQFKNVRDPIEVFALANEGFLVPKRSKMEGKLEKKPGQKKKRILALSLLVLLALGLFGYWKFYSRKKYTGSDKSIAVLPFVNMSSNKENEYYSDGMTDDLITQLYNITGLRVISRTSSMTYKGSKKSAETIAEELNVGSVLEGGIQRIGNKIRINVQWIDAKTGGHIWARIFDRDVNDLFAIQSEVAQEIAEELNARLTDSQRNKIAEGPTKNLEAWNQYQQGRYYWFKRNDSSLQAAIGFFNKAIMLDPKYARAYAGLADCYSARGYSSFIAPSEAFLKAENYADSALQLDPNLAEPHAAKGYVEFYYFWRWAKAEQEFKEAIRLNPQFDVTYDYYGYLLTATERFSEAQVVLEKANQIAPKSAAYTTDMGVSLYYDRKYDRAIDEIQDAIKYNSRYPLAHLWLARIYQVRKNYSESIASYQKALLSNPRWVPSLAGIGNVYGNMGQKAEAKKILDQLLAMSDSVYVTPYGVALVYVGMNNTDKTFEWLDKAYADRAHWLVWLKLDPRWDPIRSDKRYPPLLAKIGLPPISTSTANR